MSDDKDDEDDEDLLEEVIDACEGASFSGELADFAPPHAALEFIADCTEQADINLKDDEGVVFFEKVVREVFSDESVMEHNPLIACLRCPNEVEPLIDGQFVRVFLDLRSGKIGLPDFYLCPECGGKISAKKLIRNPDRDLPWFHHVYGEDFDLAEDEKPKS